MNNNDKTIQELQKALADYANLTGRACTEVVVEKGKQLILGSHGHGADFKGLFEEWHAKAPKYGQIRDRAQTLFSSGHGLLISKRSYEKADAVLTSNQAGLFAIPQTNSRAKLLRQIIKGKNRGLMTTKRGKNNVPVVGSVRAVNIIKRPEEKVLNRQALAANFEIVKREGSRFYTAAAFLEKYYKRTIERLKGREYRRGQLVGVSAVEAATIHKHVKKEIFNKKQNLLSTLEGESNANSAQIKLTAFVSTVQKPMFDGIAKRVMQNITSDIRNHLAKKFVAFAKFK